jgi:hypothetical protein
MKYHLDSTKHSKPFDDPLVVALIERIFSGNEDGWQFPLPKHPRSGKVSVRHEIALRLRTIMDGSRVTKAMARSKCKDISGFSPSAFNAVWKSIDPKLKVARGKRGPQKPRPIL